MSPSPTIAGMAITAMDRRDRTVAEMARTVVVEALADASLDPAQVDLVVFGNATAGRLEDQGCIRGQTFLRDVGLGGAGIVNVDNFVRRRSLGSSSGRTGDDRRCGNGPRRGC